MKRSRLSRFVPQQLAERWLGPGVAGMLDYYRFPELRSGWGGPFNGQRERLRMVEAILQHLTLDAIVETGSFRGTTTAFLAGRTRLPVFTVERDEALHGFATAALAGFTNVRCFRGDSRRFLGRLAGDSSLRDRSLFCYLDAHSPEDLPLADEVDIIFRSWPRAVVLIDDFQVPDDPGYTYDDYGPGKTLTVDYLRPAIGMFGLRLFFPSAPAALEPEQKRGCVVLAMDEDVVTTLRTLPELREWTADSVALAHVAPADGVGTNASPGLMRRLKSTLQSASDRQADELREGQSVPGMLKTKVLLKLLRSKKLVPRDPDGFLRRVSGVIHIGANAGQERDLYDHHGLRVLWIEPNPEVFRELAANVAPYPLQTAVQRLVADKDDREYPFHVSNNEGLSSSILPLKLHRDIWPDVDYTRTLTMRGTSLPTLLREEKIDPGEYDALIMDTQGSELMILKGAEAMLRNFMFIKTEVADFEAYEGCGQLSEISAFLRRCGFRQYSRRRFASRDKGGSYYDVTYQLVG